VRNNSIWIITTPLVPGLCPGTHCSRGSASNPDCTRLGSKTAGRACHALRSRAEPGNEISVLIRQFAEGCGVRVGEFQIGRSRANNLTIHLALELPDATDDAEGGLVIESILKRNGRRPIPLLDLPRAGDGRASQLPERRVDFDLFKFAGILRRTD